MTVQRMFAAACIMLSLTACSDNKLPYAVLRTGDLPETSFERLQSITNEQNARLHRPEAHPEKTGGVFLEPQYVYSIASPFTPATTDLLVGPFTALPSNQKTTQVAANLPKAIVERLKSQGLFHSVSLTNPMAPPEPSAIIMTGTVWQADSTDSGLRGDAHTQTEILLYQNGMVKGAMVLSLTQLDGTVLFPSTAVLIGVALASAAQGSRAGYTANTLAHIMKKTAAGRLEGINTSNSEDTTLKFTAPLPLPSQPVMNASLP
ncbi:hypothetical protein [Acetobacter conturbans]|uniref:Lipoprotein n=1 Tax=Acetobacter conturbans TaxID=1737472 RepID=A0ABX0JXN2_9PROT|nr:hypothetical protein [Acetobacter conturbans]NHN87589.1 hypothetical protein [Acetobacter conturbans]